MVCPLKRYLDQDSCVRTNEKPKTFSVDPKSFLFEQDVYANERVMMSMIKDIVIVGIE